MTTVTGRRPVAAIAAVSELDPGRYPDLDVRDLYRAALARAVGEWGIEPNAVDGFLVPPLGMALGSGIDVFGHERLADELGLHPGFSLTVNAGGGTYGAMVRCATAAITAGMAESVLCVGTGKFPPVAAGGGEAQAKMMCEPDFEFIYGAYIPVIYALAASCYLARYQATEKQLAAVAVAAREWAICNPQAIRHAAGPLSLDDVLASRPIASPFHLLDCSSPCEGGGAFLVTTPERARDLSDQPAYILGTGAHHSHSFISQAPDLVETGAEHSGREALAEAGLTPADIDVVELYDAFTINPLLCLEDLGFCDRGEGGDFVLEGNTQPGGPLPMNTNGGLLSFGHTGDASGLSVLVEGARQVMGTAGCQVDDADRVLVHTYGGMMGEHYTIVLGRAA